MSGNELDALVPEPLLGNVRFMGGGPILHKDPWLTAHKLTDGWDKLTENFTNVSACCDTASDEEGTSQSVPGNSSVCMNIMIGTADTL